MERTTKNTWEFELTAKLQQRNSCPKLLCDVSDQKKEGENPSHSVLVEPQHEEFSSPRHILRGTMMTLFES